MKPNEKNSPVKLLWTGGLDSTFRLLSLVFDQSLPVQPYYLKDPTRPSASLEIKTMEKIRSLVEKQRSSAGNLILPTLFFDLDEIPKKKEISEVFSQLQQIRHLGHQYDWLAQFCAWKNLNNLELGIIRKGEVSNYGESLSQSFAPYLSEVDKNIYAFDLTKVKLSANPQKGQLYFDLFQYFRFPIIHLSKKEMVTIASQKGWKKIIENTWFCHRPKNGKPCGKCNPCRTAVSEGLGNSIPLKNRIIYNLKVWLGVYRLKKMLRKKN